MKTPAPSPNGTNNAGFFIDGAAARAVRCGRATLGAAYDARFGLARDDYAPKNLDQMLADQTIQQVREALETAGLDRKVVVAVVNALCGHDPEGGGVIEDEDDDDTGNKAAGKSSSTQAVVGDDPPDFQGKPNKGAAPSPSKGSVTQDRRPAWLRSENPNAQGEARQRMLKNMSRIGHVW